MTTNNQHRTIDTKNVMIRIFVVISYIGMVIVNYLANSLPINGRTTGEVSNAYPNLFSPAGLTFSIWGLIYLLLAGYVLYQFSKNAQKKGVLLQKVNIYFIATSVANILWIFAWHFDYIGFSLIIMAALLFFLIKIADILRDEQLTLQDKLFVHAPFNVYLGWITVAAIANATVFLVSIGWNGFGMAGHLWASIIILIGAIIGILRMLKDKSVVYGLVLIWAYVGILIKHVSSTGFGGQYPVVITSVIVCLALFAFFVVRMIIKMK
ncbi:MAG: tryptophan-rich sensory protein [Bacteroidota bacterium]|nr:tryptophan-rich sensory protein [Bacteroidota bacterium]